LGELLREIVRWNVDKTIILGLFLCWLGGKREIAHDKLTSLLLHMLVKDDFVHTLGKVKVNFRKKSCCV
jgi:hypothetical protein